MPKLVFCLFFLMMLSASGWAQANRPTPTPSSKDLVKQLDEEQEAFIEQYLAGLRYLVYVDERIKIQAKDEALFRKAIITANEWLSSQGLKVVLLEQIDKLKKDYALLVEEAQGENLSVVQYLAQKLNADIYICLDLVVNSEKRAGQYYAQASLGLTVYEALTGQVLGSKTYSQLDRSVASSEELARTNAAQLAMRRLIPELIKLAQMEMRKALSQGVRYEFSLLGRIAQSTLQSLVTSLYALDLRVTKIDSLYQTEMESKFVIYYFGLANELENLIYRAAAATPELMALRLFAQRRRSFIFEIGL